MNNIVSFILFMIPLSVIGIVVCALEAVWSNKNQDRWFKTAIIFAIALIILITAELLLLDYNINYLGGILNVLPKEIL